MVTKVFIILTLLSGQKNAMIAKITLQKVMKTLIKCLYSHKITWLTLLNLEHFN